MIKHIVCFKLKDNSIESCEEAKNVFLSMKGNVPSAIDINVGIDFLRSDRSYDILLEVLLKDKDSLEIYQSDPYHVNTVKAYIHPRRISSITVDYEI